MNSTTSSHAEQLLNFLFKGTSFVLASSTASWNTPPTHFLGLLKSVGYDGTLTEVSVGSYVRLALAVGDWNTASTSNFVTTMTLGTAKTFATPTADWGIITHVGIFTAITSGSLLEAAELTSPLTVTNGNAPIIQTGTNGIIVRLGNLG